MNSVLEQSTSEKWDLLLIKTANCWRRLQSFTGLISNWWKLFNFKHTLDIYLSFSLYNKLWCAAKVKFCQIKEKYNEEIDCNHLNKVNSLSWNYEKSTKVNISNSTFNENLSKFPKHKNDCLAFSGVRRQKRQSYTSWKTPRNSRCTEWTSVMQR